MTVGFFHHIASHYVITITDVYAIHSVNFKSIMLDVQLLSQPISVQSYQTVICMCGEIDEEASLAGQVGHEHRGGC